MGRRVGLVMVRAAASAVLLWLALRRIDLVAVGALFHRLQWGWAAAAFGVLLSIRAVSCLRLIVLIRAKGLAHDPGAVSKIVVGSQFYGVLLPTTVGGDAIRLFALARHTANAPEAISAILVDRVLGIAALLALGGASAIWAWWHLGDHRLLWAALLTLSAGLVVLGLSLAGLWTARISRWSWVSRQRWAGKLADCQRAIRTYRRHPEALAQVFLISMALHGLRMVTAYLCGLALGAFVPFIYFAALVPLTTMVSLLPISIGGLGVRENAFVYGFGLVGVPAALAFSLSILAYTLAVLATVPGGLWVLWSARTDRMPATATTRQPAAPRPAVEAAP